MTWDLASECVSVIILSIIGVYSKKENPLPTLRNIFFRACFIITLCSMVSNIISTIMIYNYTFIPLILTKIVTTIYFISTPLMATFYFYYTISVIVTNERTIIKIISFCSIPAIIYVIFVLSNPITGFMFDISSKEGYTQGLYISITYIIFYIYCFMCIVFGLFKKSDVNTSTKKIITVFPALAILVIIVQQFFPSYLLSGSAATCTLLIIYLYLENKQIYIDYLTGFLNRQVLLEILELKIKKRKSEAFMLIVFSLRGFKQINNKFGQQSGNDFIKQISIFLKEIADQHHLYRFSGDEFAILIDENSVKNSTSIIEKITERMLSPWHVENYSCLISYAIGIVQHSEDLNSVEKIIDGIEYAVAKSKLDVTSNCIFCSPQMLEQIKRRDLIIDILKENLNNNTFEVYFQPIFNLETSEFSLAECLLRLNNTSLGPISPVEFIPIAEDTGLIIPITYQILDNVCKFIRRLIDSHIEFSGISINFSAKQFEDQGFIEKVINIIKNNNIPFSKIKIEITESVLANNFSVVQNFMSEMHDIGVLFGLDDFGTGYSNISYVLQLPWDTIKLDKSLIWSAMENKKSRALVTTIVGAIRNLDLIVLAEGIETIEQSDFVAECGCSLIQGFLYAKPMTSQESEKFIGKPIII